MLVLFLFFLLEQLIDVEMYDSIRIMEFTDCSNIVVVHTGLQLLLKY